MRSLSLPMKAYLFAQTAISMGMLSTAVDDLLSKGIAGMITGLLIWASFVVATETARRGLKIWLS